MSYSPLINLLQLLLYYLINLYHHFYLLFVLIPLPHLLQVVSVLHLGASGHVRLFEVGVPLLRYVLLMWRHKCLPGATIELHATNLVIGLWPLVVLYRSSYGPVVSGRIPGQWWCLCLAIRQSCPQQGRPHLAELELGSLMLQCLFPSKKEMVLLADPLLDF